MPCRSWDELLNGYTFPLQPESDFQLDGRPAEYASGHPKEWGYETDAFDFSTHIKGEFEADSSGYYSALSPDKKLLAISSGNERIVIFDIASKEVRQVLDGSGRVIFIPSPSRGGGKQESEDEPLLLHGRPSYILVSSIRDAATPSRYTEGDKLMIWELDHRGRLLDDEEPVDHSALATKAIDAILPDLSANHEWTKAFVAASTLRVDFAKALSKVAADHRRQHNPVIEKARLTGFGSESISQDGKLLLFLREVQKVTRHKRRAGLQRHIIVYDIEAGRDIHQLSGHTDDIMWSGISGDSQHIATVAWDGTLRMYSAATGGLDWATESASEQAWAGAFTPDSKHIVWSSKSGMNIQVLEVATGCSVAKFPEKLRDWCRCFAWHPDGQQLALCAGPMAFVWRPFENGTGTVSQRFEIDDDNGWRMAGIEKVHWMDDGRLLCVRSNEGTNLVYDTRTNAKEVFRRPKRARPAWSDNGFYGVFSDEGVGDYYVSVDGDGKVRYWRTSVAAGPSWWEKETGEKKGPETGKYVNVVKLSKKEEKPDEERPLEEKPLEEKPLEEKPQEKTLHEGKPGDDNRAFWADKGAGLWTAE